MEPNVVFLYSRKKVGGGQPPPPPPCFHYILFVCLFVYLKNQNFINVFIYKGAKKPMKNSRNSANNALEWNSSNLTRTKIRFLRSTLAWRWVLENLDFHWFFFFFLQVEPEFIVTCLGCEMIRHTGLKLGLLKEKIERWDWGKCYGNIKWNSLASMNSIKAWIS